MLRWTPTDEEPEGAPPEVNNVVATFSVQRTLDLPGLCMKFPFCEYQPSRFAALTVRCAKPRTTCLAFASGRMVCTGAKTPIAALLASRRYVSLFEELGETMGFADFKIQNIVASFSLPGAVDLEKLAQSCGVFASYEPEVFPGLVLRTQVETRALCVLVFRSGRCVITGAKAQEDIVKMWRFLSTGVLKGVTQRGGQTCSAQYRREVKKQRISSLLG